MVEFDYSRVDKAIQKSSEKLINDIFDELTLYFSVKGDITVALHDNNKYRVYNLIEIIQDDLNNLEEDTLQILKHTLESCLQIVNSTLD